jgi:hypothetical protein
MQGGKQMKWFLNLTTRTKLFLCFGLMVIFLVAVVLTAYTGITAIYESQKHLKLETFALRLAPYNPNWEGKHDQKR